MPVSIRAKCSGVFDLPGLPHAPASRFKRVDLEYVQQTSRSSRCALHRGAPEATTDDSSRDTQIIHALARAYSMELEPVANLIALSVNLDGVRAEHIEKELDADIATELAHAQIIARRIKTVGGTVPGSMQLKMDQKSLQPPSGTIDIEYVIRGVIAAEEAAIAQHERIIELAGGYDPANEDLATTALGDEEEHRRDFIGFLKEVEAGRIAAQGWPHGRSLDRRAARSVPGCRSVLARLAGA